MVSYRKEEPALVLANYILGGNGGSHLFSRIRDNRSGTKEETSFVDEVTRTVRDGLPAAEVAAANKCLSETQVIARSQDLNLASRQRFDRTLKFDEMLEADMLEAKIAAPTPEEIGAALRRHLDPAGLAIVEAGDFQKAGVVQ